MVTVTKTYNLEIKGNLFVFTEAEAKELFNALDSVLNGKTYPKPGEWVPVNNFSGTLIGPSIAQEASDPLSRVGNWAKLDKFKL